MAASAHMASTAAEQTGDVGLLIAVAGPVDDERLRARAEEGRFPVSADGLRVAIASPASGQAEASEPVAPISSGMPFLRYALSPSGAPALPWLAVPAAYSEIARLAASVGAKACVVISPDLAALDPASIESLADPLLDSMAQLSMPLYPTGKHEALLNSGILYPFTRSLYGKHLRHPFAVDFGMGSNMIARLASGARSNAQAIISPAVDAAAAGLTIAQACLGVLHPPNNDGIDLSTVLARLCAAIFEDAERNAASWQRVRGSQPLPIHGRAAETIGDGDGIDVRPLIESFHLGFRNLREIWSLVLPPVALLELQRLTRLPPEQFRIPDSLWAKIMYDFALAHRLRSISRAHLLGALTPLYLGWVASYTAEIRTMDAVGAEERIESLAVAYEEAKPYFVSRWRWPDRFNP